MRNKFASVSDPNKFVTSSGDCFHIEFSPVVNSDGTISLVESGKEDICAKINSYKDTTDMTFILKQLALGNTSVLFSGSPFYGDFTSMPESYADALQMVIDAERSFNKLPLDVRNSFDNDYRKWFATAGSEFWLKFMDPVIKKDPVVDPVVKESVTDES